MKMRVRLGIAVALFAAVGAVAAGSAFAPVEYKETGETSFEVSVWGWTYRYENSVFPVSVKTAGREIFAAPMSLHAKFGDVEGKFAKWQYTLAKGDPDETFAVADARAIARFYNRLCGFDGQPPLLAHKTLDVALEPCRHVSDPLPPPDKLDKDWFMVFGMGYGLWGDSKNISRIFGHGGIGGSEGLCDRDKRLTTGFTCNFGKDVRKVRDLLYAVVGMCWRYGNDKGADIQEIQMRQMEPVGTNPEGFGACPQMR